MAYTKSEAELRRALQEEESTIKNNLDQASATQKEIIAKLQEIEVEHEKSEAQPTTQQQSTNLKDKGLTELMQKSIDLRQAILRSIEQKHILDTELSAFNTDDNGNQNPNNLNNNLGNDLKGLENNSGSGINDLAKDLGKEINATDELIDKIKTDIRSPEKIKEDLTQYITEMKPAVKQMISDVDKIFSKKPQPQPNSTPQPQPQPAPEQQPAPQPKPVTQQGRQAEGGATAKETEKAAYKTSRTNINHEDAKHQQQGQLLQAKQDSAKQQVKAENSPTGQPGSTVSYPNEYKPRIGNNNHAHRELLKQQEEKKAAARAAELKKTQEQQKTKEQEAKATNATPIPTPSPGGALKP